jgi:hypothetical protein
VQQQRKLVGELYAAAVAILGRFCQGLGNTGPKSVKAGRRVPISGGGVLRCWLITTAGLEC